MMRDLTRPALRRRILENPETLQDIELAAGEKYKEGCALKGAGYDGAAIYLLGYTAEMVLKYACFRYMGEPGNRQVRGLLAPARNRARAYLPGISVEGYHSVWFWAMWLRKQRQLDGRFWRSSFDHRYLQSTRRIYQNWVAQMRYQVDQCLPDEAELMIEEVEWLIKNWMRLWR